MKRSFILFIVILFLLTSIMVQGCYKNDKDKSESSLLNDTTPTNESQKTVGVDGIAVFFPNNLSESQAIDKFNQYKTENINSNYFKKYLEACDYVEAYPLFCPWLEEGRYVEYELYDIENKLIYIIILDLYHISGNIKSIYSYVDPEFKENEPLKEYNHSPYFQVIRKCMDDPNVENIYGCVKDIIGYYPVVKLKNTDHIKFYDKITNQYKDFNTGNFSTIEEGKELLTKYYTKEGNKDVIGKGY